MNILLNAFFIYVFVNIVHRITRIYLLRNFLQRIALTLTLDFISSGAMLWKPIVNIACICFWLVTYAEPFLINEVLTQLFFSDIERKADCILKCIVLFAWRLIYDSSMTRGFVNWCAQKPWFVQPNRAKAEAFQLRTRTFSTHERNSKSPRKVSSKAQSARQSEASHSRPPASHLSPREPETHWGLGSSPSHCSRPAPETHWGPRCTATPNFPPRPPASLRPSFYPPSILERKEENSERAKRRAH